MKEEYLQFLSLATHKMLPSIKKANPILYPELASYLKTLDLYGDELSARVIAKTHIYLLNKQIKTLEEELNAQSYFSVENSKTVNLHRSSKQLVECFSAGLEDES